ncbi:SET [Glarea lozoyensis ATCC 20868]|uniref:SET n=2 Tax=Glarea lozoyensis TaxID=101852 RepID=S3D6A9_GLAL2|nr:SET [Glarea lozoyensis ATCC 20868]EHL01706.1 putative Ribosomal N-lysine methyltransferase 4 [Glarea lozoyensis 74030]EPE34022.1 SET [Glarea lozoyensis ATCC 20868]
MESDSFQATTEAFLEWLSKIGVRINPKMTLKDLKSEGRGRGVVAAADFEEDEVVFCIPRTAVLNVNNVFAGQDSGASKEALLQMPNWLALTATMMSEGQQSDSRWAPYLAVLPQKLDSLVFWSEEELAELQASSVAKKIGRSSAEEMFTKHISPLGLGEFNVELCHQVASVIMAYAFDIPEEEPAKQENGGAEGETDDLVSDDGEDEKTILSMIPLADMLNADAERNNARIYYENEDLEMRTIKPIMAGEEIFNDYGQLPRSDLLRRYGYVTENYAQYDVVEISSASIKSLMTEKPQEIQSGQFLDPLTSAEAEERVALADREGILEDSYDVNIANAEERAIPDELLALLYLFLLDNENLEAIVTSQSALPSRSKLATELVGKVLVKVLRHREAEYATTLEEDEKLLQAANLPRRTAMAIQVRHGEKRVLRLAVEEAMKFEAANKRMRPIRGSALNTAKNGSNLNNKRRAEEVSKPGKKGRLR